MALMGNVKDARRALNCDLREIGSGCTRVVFVDDDEKYVYKVGLTENYDSSNVGEHLMLEVMRESTKWGKNCPRTRLIHVDGRVVLVMKYFPCRVRRSSKFLSMQNSLYRDNLLYDFADFNAREDEDGNVFIIDAGEAGYSDGDFFVTVLQTGKGPSPYKY